MDLEIRPIGAEELPLFARAEGVGFGYQPEDKDIDYVRPGFEADRSLAAFDRGAIVGTAGAFSFDLTLPGLTTVPVAAVSWVSVLPTHRRRGILTALMARQLADVRARDEAVAVLTASESLIYGRFGYGVGTLKAAIEIDKAHASYLRPLPTAGRLALLDRDQASKVVPEVFDRARLLRPGNLSRTSGYWESHFADPEAYREGASARFYVAHESEAGQPDGYVSYRIKERSTHGLADDILDVTEIIAESPAIRAELWRYCLDVDLVSQVEYWNCPPDEPLRWLLRDPRRMRTTGVADFLWARLVDVAAALAARRYAVEDRIVLELVDGFLPDNAGRYILEGGPDGAECRRAGDEADLVLDVADLGAAYLGGVRFTTLADAGRVQERTPGALGRADLLFGSDRAPWCPTPF